MAGMNVFTGDAFSTFELTDALEGVPYKPNWIGSLGIFEEKPVRTETVAIEKRGNKLTLIQTTPRGAPLPQQTKGQRTIRDFHTVRVAKGDRINASEIQDLRKFGSTTELQSAQEEVMQRMVSLRNDAELTHENMRLGAIRGVVTDADGSIIRNWFDEWGIAVPSIVSLGLDSDTTEVRTQCHEITRLMARNSEGTFRQQTQVCALAGDNFFDKLVSHPSVKDTYRNWTAAEDMRGNLAFGEFVFGGIRWVNYRGTDDGEVGISPNEAQLFPIGAPGVFKVARSPGESLDFVNTLGRDFYALQVPDKDRNMWVDVEVYSYPLFMCTVPQVLQRVSI